MVNRTWRVFTIVVISCSFLFHESFIKSSANTEAESSSHHPSSCAQCDGDGEPSTRTLVIVAFSCTDSHISHENLRFLLNEGVAQRPDVEFVLAIMGSPKCWVGKIVVPTYTNVHVVSVPLMGFETCAYEAALKTLANSDLTTVDGVLATFDFIVFMNSTVRGPFLPSFYQKFWTYALTDMLDKETLLVGPYVSCEKSPHVQSMVRAMSVGTYIQYRHNFECVTHKNTMNSAEIKQSVKDDFVDSFEVGLSEQILNDGYNIASPLLAYKGADFRLEESRSCNEERNPYTGFYFSESNAPNPLDSIFVKNSGTILHQFPIELEKSLALYGGFLKSHRKHPNMAMETVPLI